MGLSGTNYDGNLVRIRSETLYNRNGQTERSRSGLAHVETPDGTFAGVFDEQSIDSQPHYDAFDNVYRSDLITGGTLTYDEPPSEPHAPAARLRATASPGSMTKTVPSPRCRLPLVPSSFSGTIRSNRSPIPPPAT